MMYIQTTSVLFLDHTAEADKQRAASMKSAAAKLTEDEYDTIASRYNSLGRVIECEELYAAIVAESGKLFAAGKDSDAQLLRGLARMICERAKNMRADYDKAFPNKNR